MRDIITKYLKCIQLCLQPEGNLSRVRLAAEPRTESREVIIGVPQSAEFTRIHLLVVPGPRPAISAWVVYCGVWDSASLGLLDVELCRSRTCSYTM